jgi:hypothetical protein
MTFFAGVTYAVADLYHLDGAPPLEELRRISRKSGEFPSAPVI